jgi:copper ion binding protein
MEKKTINVIGMSCEHCVKAVTKAVSSVSGISDVSVNLKGGTVTFNYAPAATDLAAVEASIVDAGFEVGK